MEINNLQKALTGLIFTFDNLEIPYYIGGSVASSLFGIRG